VDRSGEGGGGVGGNSRRHDFLLDHGDTARLPLGIVWPMAKRNHPSPWMFLWAVGQVGVVPTWLIL